MLRLRLFSVILIGAVASTFFPTSWTTYEDWSEQLQLKQYFDLAAPITVSLIEQAQAQFKSGQYVVLDGRRVPTSSAGVPVPQPDSDVLVNDEPQCTLDAAGVRAVLEQKDSPALEEAGLPERIVELCQEYRIDDGIILAMGIMESQLGTDPGWAGHMPDGKTSKNLGNIICGTKGQVGCYDRFGVYDTWADGVEEKYLLLSCYQTGAAGRPECSGIWSGGPIESNSLAAALNRYAPPFENNTSEYTQFVLETVRGWRSVRQGQFVAEGAEGQQVVRKGVSAPLGSFTAPPLALTGCLGTNVRSAHNSSPGLHDVSIPPGADWSFNEHWVINGDGTLVDCGVYGGGVCNQASRWSNVARNLGLEVRSVYHGYIYDGAVPAEDNLAIWSSGVRGGQDLIIVNTSNKTLHLKAVIDGDTYTVQGWFE